MKQTAIDWLINQLTEVDKGCINKTYLQLNKTLGGIHLKDIFEQAKTLEKQQIIDAVSKGWNNNEEGLVRWIGEQHYTETFK
jgi:hypothetical protein